MTRKISPIYYWLLPFFLLLLLAYYRKAGENESAFEELQSSSVEEMQSFPVQEDQSFEEMQGSLSSEYKFQWGNIEALRLTLLQTILGHVEDKDTQNFMKSQLEQLGDIDGLAKWRKEESEKLSSLVQSAITRNQNPTDCGQAKKLVCHLNQKGCGLGCIIHHGVQCLLTAFGTGRVLFISNQTWGYNDRFVIKQFFSPISSSCSDFESPTKSIEKVFPNDTTQVIEQIADWHTLIKHENTPYYLPALPTKLAPRILKLIKNPDIWWVGQFVAYFMRPNETVGRILSEAEKKIDFSSPIVGIHVRRTDKLKDEAELIGIERYMEQAELWFRKYEITHPPTRRRIYLATDEPQVILECHEKYPEYEIIDNPDISKLVNGGRNKDTDASFIGTIQDIHMLALMDHVICTLSSNMGTVVYELLHFKHGDASGMLQSMDIPWWNLYRKSITFEALVDDPSTNLMRGDILDVNTNFANSIHNFNHTFVNTTNARTNVYLNETKAYPLYKLKQIPKLNDFPNLNNVV